MRNARNVQNFDRGNLIADSLSKMQQKISEDESRDAKSGFFNQNVESLVSRSKCFSLKDD